MNPSFVFFGKWDNTDILLIDTEKDNKAVEDIIAHVRGGNSGWATGLAHNSSFISYRSWGRSLKYNPAVIDFEVSPFAVEETLCP